MDLRKILIVDRDKQFSMDFRNSLERHGYSVSLAFTISQATEQVRITRFSLIVVGEVEHVGAANIFSRLRAIDPNAMGILLLQDATVVMVMEAMKAGFSRVVDKSSRNEEVVATIEDVLDATSLRDENTRLKTLLPLYKLGRKFMSAMSSEQIYTELVNAIHEEIRVPTISVMIYDPESNLLKIAASKGISEQVVAKAVLVPGEKIAGWVFENDEPVILNRRTQGSSKFSKYLLRGDISASISYPLKIRDRVVGVVNLSQRDGSVEYSQADLEMLSVICDQAAMAHENIIAIEKRQETFRLKTLFGQYVAPEIADFLLNQNQNMLDVGEVKELTVLFADIRSFTLLVQRISPTEVRNFLNEFFEFFVNAVFDEGGTLDKFMGDAALVLFGAPAALDCPEKSAVQAAIKIHKGFNELQSRWAKKYELFNTIGIGIGVSRGNVYLGNVGSERRLDFTVIGSAVNISQRLASEPNTGKILVTESVKKSVAGQFAIVDEGNVPFRGLEEAIPVYSIVVDGEG